MRKAFLKWLLAFVAAAFALAVLISFSVQTNMAAESADELIGQRLVDADTRIDDYLDRSAQTRATVDGLLIEKAHAIAQIVASDPAIVADKDHLAQLVDNLGIDELVVTDSRGIVVASVPEENVGFDMAHSEQSSAFLGAIDDPGFELAQEFREKGLGTSEVKYAGVARIDELGIVQVGYYRERMDKVVGVVDMASILNNLSIGQDGKLYLVHGQAVVSATDASDIGRMAASLGLGDCLEDDCLAGASLSVDGEPCRVASARHEGYVVVAALPESEVFLNRNSSLASTVAFNFGVFLLVFILVSVLLQKVVVDGIFRVNASLGKITAGDLDERVEVRDNPEFEALSDGINETVEALKGHIAAEASRIDVDLALARAIQLGNLRTDFPAFPEQRAFDLHALMAPAREVGGDFYDMFMLDERRLVAVVADVSDKGIPAAMFMMEAKSCIGMLASSGLPLGEVLERANEKLCANNGPGLFVTAFIVSLDVRTGGFEYVNAGHNPPVVLPRTGEASFLPVKPGFVLGGMEGMRYRAQEGSLAPGDALVLYTDGVTEALDEEGALYGEDRLLAFLEQRRADSSQAIVEGLKEEIMGYRGAAEQADDLTVLAVRYHGVDEAAITVRASDDDLDVVLDFLDGHLESKGFAPKARNQVRLAAEEVFVNIAHYAYAEAGPDEPQGTAVVAVRFAEDDAEAVIDFYDAGVPYDPLTAGDPDITLSAEERDIGGLGIYMTKQLMDGVAYLHEKGKNHLTLRKRK